MDIAVVTALNRQVASSAREDLDSVLQKVDIALDAEVLARESGDASISQSLVDHSGAQVGAHSSSAITATAVARGSVISSAFVSSSTIPAIEATTRLYSSSIRISQPFTPSFNDTVKSVILDLIKVGTLPSATFTVGIYSDNAGFPDTLLQTSTTSFSTGGTQISTQPGNVALEFLFTGLVVTSGTQYHLVLSWSGASGDAVYNYIGWQTYASGTIYYSTNSGVTYSPITGTAVHSIFGLVADDVAESLSDIEGEKTALDSLENEARRSYDAFLLKRLNEENVDLLRLTATNATKVVTIGSSISSRSLDGAALKMPNGSLTSDFTGATINFSTGTFTGQVATFTRINFTGQASQWAKYALILLPTQPDQILVIPGTSFGATAALAADPAFSGGIPIGIVAVQDDGSAGIGTINNIAQADLAQFKSSGSGSGSGSGSPLDPDQESNYAFYARSDFSVDQKTFFGSVTGATDQVLGLGRVRFTAVSQLFTSSNLVGPQQFSEANLILRATAKLRYDHSYRDPSPIIQMSRDGGATYVTATNTTPSNNGELVLGDAQWTADTLTSGTLTGSVTSNQYIALIFTPQYDQVINSFDFYLGTSSLTGTVTGYLKNASGGIPTTTIATSVTKNLGTDVTTTRSYSNFPFTAVTLTAGTTYAITVEGSSATLLTTETVSSPAAWATSGATANWGANSNRYGVNIYGAGNDLRLKVTSSAPSTEFRLLGFGVDFVLIGPATVSGTTQQETRIVTSTESTTGIITLGNVTYTPGMRQLYVKASNHIFMGPEDFTELSPTQIQFSSGFFSTGQIITIFTGYGLVDGSSISLSKFNVLYDAIVGSTSQVSAGIATHSTLTSAISAVSSGGNILVLDGTYVENITLNKELFIEGQGHSSVITGNWTFQSASDFSIIQRLKFNGNITLNAGADKLFIQTCFQSNTGTFTDNSGSFDNVFDIITE